jgi:septation ring formation regulator EzrA
MQEVYVQDKSHNEISEKLKKIKGFMSKEQYSIICLDTDSTEYEFKEIVNNLYQLFKWISYVRIIYIMLNCIIFQA